MGATSHAPSLSVIVPCRDEAPLVASALCRLQWVRSRGHELIVVDGGSRDATAELARPLADRVISCTPGRALQMNAGARVASGEVLWFLHLDTLVPPDADRHVIQSMSEGKYLWGRFDVRLSGAHPAFRVIATLMNLRSRLTGIATGDQGIFVRRTVFERAGGFPEIPIMEDVAISRVLKRHGRPLCLRVKLTASSRRWESQGIVSTVVMMWRLRLAYARGADPEQLVASYYPTKGR